MNMELPQAYSIRVQTCIQCPQGVSRSSSCGVDGEQYHHHATVGTCPAGRYAGNWPAPAAIDPDYVPTPANATRGRCCS